MTRYKALRFIGCDWLTAASISLMNRIWGVPAGTICFMHFVIEYPLDEESK